MAALPVGIVPSAVILLGDWIRLLLPAPPAAAVRPRGRRSPPRPPPPALLVRGRPRRSRGPRERDRGGHREHHGVLRHVLNRTGQLQGVQLELLRRRDRADGRWSGTGELRGRVRVSPPVKLDGGSQMMNRLRVFCPQTLDNTCS